MSYQRRVLLIDDEPSEHKVLEGLAASGYSVRSSYSGRDGIVAARDWRPDVTLVDYVMPEMDGPAVCTELKQHPTTKDLPVVMFSHERTRLNFQTGFQSADDYIEKSIDFEILIEKLRAWSRHFLPYPLIEGHRQLVLTCTPNQPLSFRIDAGCATFNTARGPLEIEEDLYSSIANLLPHHSKVLNQDSLRPVEDNWRQLSKSEGWSIYSKIFKNFPELLAEYTAAKRSAEKDRNLHIQIESPRSLIPFPFEFFFDDKPADGGGEFLVVRHPLSRVVTTQGGGPARRRGISRNFLNNIRRAQNENQSDGKLRILLIASNTLPAIPGVDDEVDLLAKLIPESFANVGLDVDLRKVPTAEASLENVEKLLRDSDFHIIHFAGHGSFDTTTPERSYLLFWRDPGKNGPVVPLRTDLLWDLLETSNVRFAYFSCCSAMASGSPDQAKRFSYLGLADAALKGQVPGVLGFRWRTSDTGALEHAAEFYRNLAKHGELDTALMRARIAVRQQLPDDPSWLSPILIVQP